MTTLLVDRKHTRLSVRDGAIILAADGQVTRRVGMAQVDTIVLRSPTDLDSCSLAQLADAGIGVHAFAGRGGSKVAHVLGAPGKEVARRIAQARRLDDDAFRSHWSRRVLQAKLGAQTRLLRTIEAQRPDLRKPLFDALLALQRASRSLSTATDVAVLRGLEGAAAAAFFRAYARAFPPSLGFVVRRRRPPPDAVNALLSLGYTLLHGLVVQVLHGTGLDPMLGYLHVPEHGRASLACDLMEPWRARVERMVWELVRQRALEATHFRTETSGTCRLGKRGRQIFYAAWFGQEAALRRAVRRQARLAVQAITTPAPGAGAAP